MKDPKTNILITSPEDGKGLTISAEGLDLNKQTIEVLKGRLIERYISAIATRRIAYTLPTSGMGDLARALYGDNSPESISKVKADFINLGMTVEFLEDPGVYWGMVKTKPIYYDGAISMHVPEPGKVSDGYHTFDELYEHRYLLFLTLFIEAQAGGCGPEYWKSRKHHDGTEFPGEFIAGMPIGKKTITYHLPEKYWHLCEADELDRAPEWDGHTSADVAARMLAALETYHKPFEDEE